MLKTFALKTFEITSTNHPRRIEAEAAVVQQSIFGEETNCLCHGSGRWQTSHVWS